MSKILSSPEFRSKLAEIEARHREVGRNLAQLRYYCWLEDNGMSWDQVLSAGIPRRQGNFHGITIMPAVEFKLKSGERRIVKDVPPNIFTVIFNRNDADKSSGSSRT